MNSMTETSQPMSWTIITSKTKAMQCRTNRLLPRSLTLPHLQRGRSCCLPHWSIDFTGGFPQTTAEQHTSRKQVSAVRRFQSWDLVLVWVWFCFASLSSVKVLWLWAAHIWVFYFITSVYMPALGPAANCFYCYSSTVSWHLKQQSLQHSLFARVCFCYLQSSGSIWILRLGLECCGILIRVHWICTLLVIGGSSSHY